MKKKKIFLLIAIYVIALIAVSAIWYFTPTIFLNGVEPSDVKSISVFDGNTGKSFDINSTDKIRYIVENINNTKMKKKGLSIAYSGYSFRMSFYDEAGKEIDNFIINSADTIRKDPFFYSCDGNPCFDYLKELENEY